MNRTVFKILLPFFLGFTVFEIGWGAPQEAAIPKYKVQFVPWSDPAGIEFSYGNPRGPMGPVHGLFGHLGVDHIPESEFPIRVEFSFYPVKVRLNRYSGGVTTPSELEKSFVWGQIVGIVGSKTRDLPLCIQSVEVDKNARSRPLPVWDMPIPFGFYSSKTEQFRSLKISIYGKTETLLAQRVLLDAYMSAMGRHGGQIAFALDEEEADRVFKEGGYSQVKRVSSLYPQYPFYLNVGAVWVSAELMNRSKQGSPFFKRLLLSGKKIVGREKTMGQLRSLLGLGKNSGVLTGGLFGSDAFIALKDTGLNYNESFVHNENYAHFNPLNNKITYLFKSHPHLLSRTKSLKNFLISNDILFFIIYFFKENI